ncbi:MAG: leucine--tRNA ligase [Candidatus Aminicenantes bacterium]|nr:leucine--tRNA ligase [Candidatus Aminicenantes bacterium]
MKAEYKFKDIEEKWQERWEKEGAFRSVEDTLRKKFYCLEMFPYPSGRIHMGHVRNYSIGDVISRCKIMKGFDVLHPIGWDALGMPAENAAIRMGVHPQEWTLENISYMKNQLKELGFSYDWSREINTCSPEYYKWNQWIFLKMLERGLAYRKKSWLNWCPQCRTVLANEQVIGQQCWRCDTVVVQKEMEQWFLRITEYAEELISGHEQLEKWPEHVLTMQKNWIGKSTGAYVTFPIVGQDQEIEVFTTRIDTIYGATFLVLSPEHPLSNKLVSHSNQREKLQEWIRKTIHEQHIRKEASEEEKSGIDTGQNAINPFTEERIPIWIANYVLMEYGTGAIMAVPGHDQRDFEFAKKYSLPIKEVIIPEGGQPQGELKEVFEEHGIVINSGPFSGKKSIDAIEQMALCAQEKGIGRKSTIYRLRDWGISRQRYWGTPIPVVYCENCGIVGVPYEDLPVVLPFNVELKGKEGSPLENVDDFVKTKCPKCNREARREIDTMDTFFDSSWYYFRYCSPDEKGFPFDSKSADYWLPVDLYIGGVEHAILHLIYARFFCKVLRDFGLTRISEPFPRLLAQGMVLKDGTAMSKSKGNVVDPDDMVKKYGTDTLRLFILFAAPPEKEFAWNEKGVGGCFRFLNRIWTFFQENMDIFKQSSQEEDKLSDDKPAMRLKIKMHQTIKKVGEDIEIRHHLNTAISSIMEFFNVIRKESDELKKSISGKLLLKDAMEKLIMLLSPFAPHICEELWEVTGHKTLLAHTCWPTYDPNLAKEEMVTIVVQVNGKLREKFLVKRDTPEDEIKELALGLDRIRNIIGEKEVRKVVCVKNKLINIVL